jgi:phosphatidylserine decarboxylase
MLRSIDANETPPSPSLRQALVDVLLQEDINFLLTNRIPRRYATLAVGWLSRIEIPWVRDASIALWRMFADDLRLDEAKHAEWKSLHDCFIRELRDGARPIDRDPGVIVSPCDGVVGACGPLRGIEAIQAKGFPYRLIDLLDDPAAVERYRDGLFVTLRLKSNFYHRFHAPCDGHVGRVRYISGDTWNVNPIALKRVERLFCRNERAVIEVVPHDPDETVAIVAVAAILVASIKLHFLDRTLDLRYRGANLIPCDADLHRGEEMGYFEAGSTIIVFAPPGFRLHDGVVEGTTIRVGQPLLRRPARPFIQRRTR